MRLCLEKSTKARGIKQLGAQVHQREGAISKVVQETETMGNNSVRRSEIPAMGNQCKNQACLGKYDLPSVVYSLAGCYEGLINCRHSNIGCLTDAMFTLWNNAWRQAWHIMPYWPLSYPQESVSTLKASTTSSAWHSQKDFCTLGIRWTSSEWMNNYHEQMNRCQGNLVLSQLPSERNVPHIPPIPSKTISGCGDICWCCLPRTNRATFQEEQISFPLGNYPPQPVFTKGRPKGLASPLLSLECAPNAELQGQQVVRADSTQWTWRVCPLCTLPSLPRAVLLSALSPGNSAILLPSNLS